MNPMLAKVRAIFDRAIELPPKERAVFVQNACGSDLALRNEVEGLLRALDRAGVFMAEPEIESGQLGSPYSLGTKIGPYTLLKVIGTGGAGTVYLAQQDAPLKRKVALKVITPGMDSRQVIARFDLERQVLAVMEHPHIAKVLDAGSTGNGRPFFVMEWVDGKPITEYVQQEKLELAGRLMLFVAVCMAVEHAHRKGIVHRDLKPGNVLVVLQDGKPVPKVIDFGIAKSLSPENIGRGGEALTVQQQFLGTPQYMSPEQSELPKGQVDSRSDVYSLGALLYELLTDQLPFDREQLRQASYVEIHRILRELEPVVPSERLIEESRAATGFERIRLRRWSGSLRGDLDQIVQKAMEKDASRRYESAKAFGRDVERYLAHEPVLARSRGWFYRTGKFIRRRRMPLATASVLMLAIGIAIAGLLPRVTTGGDESPLVGLTSTARAASPLARLPEAQTLLSGLTAEIFTNGRFNGRVATRIDPQINFYWPRGVPPAPGMKTPKYAIRWSGVLKVPNGPAATLKMSWDDGVRVWIDERVVMAYSRPGNTSAQSTVAPGLHRIVVEYWNELAEGRVQLSWQLSGKGAETLVPAEALWHEPESGH
jgi:serine/threonine protein kinase